MGLNHIPCQSCLNKQGVIAYKCSAAWGIEPNLKMKFEDIYQFFRDPPPVYLNKELTVCYVLSVLAEGDSYGTELIQKLEREYAMYRLSDTVLYSALKFLESENAIKGYWKKVEGRGRPRRMYQVREEWINKAQELANLWQEYVKNGSFLPSISPVTNSASNSRSNKYAVPMQQKSR